MAFELDRIGSDPMPDMRRVNFAQTDLTVHDAWGKFCTAGPQQARAAGLLHMMVARMDKQNALVAPREVLAEIAGCSVSTVKRSLALLKEGHWIDVVQLGKGGLNAYVINSRVAWRDERKNLVNAIFTATVIASTKDQDHIPEPDEALPALRRIPTLYAGEQALPMGAVLEPPVQGQLPGVEHEVPSLRMVESIDLGTGEITDLSGYGAEKTRRLRNI